MARFLHTADWQMGRQYSRFDEEDAAVLANARFDAVAALAALAAQERVDAVLVAGDVFDAQTVSDRTLHRTFQAMAAFTGPWVLIPGNHDAALPENPWVRAERLAAIPANAHVLLKSGVTPFAESGFAILAAPLTQRETFDDLTTWFDTAETAPGLLRIGIAHGSVEGELPEAADASNPIAADRAVTARLDYLALGDWHGTKEINARAWYSGTPEQERFKDNGAGQALIVDIAGPGSEPRVEPRAIGHHRWLKREETLALDSDVDRIVAMLAGFPAAAVVDLTLMGQIDLAGNDRLRQAVGAAVGRLRSLAVHQDALRLAPTAEDLAALQADGYVGEVIAALREQQGGSEHPDTARAALAILADALHGRSGGAES